MKTLRIATSVSIVLLAWSGCAVSQELRIDGVQARQLVSILASGSDEIFNSLASFRGVRVSDLRVLAQATFKFDADDPRYRIERYSAWGQVNGSDERAEIHDATSLWAFLVELGFAADSAMEGSSLSLGLIDCKVDARLDFADAARFQCDLKGVD